MPRDYNSKRGRDQFLTARMRAGTLGSGAELGVQQRQMADEKDPSAKNDEIAPAPADVVLMHGRTEDGEGIRVLRAREGKVEAGELRAMKQGVPLASGEVVCLSQRAEHPLLWDVKVQCRVETGKGHGGPARVATRAYRRNWDSIFNPPDVDEASEGESTLN